MAKANEGAAIIHRRESDYAPNPRTGTIRMNARDTRDDTKEVDWR
jgi:hypothetical protein